MAAKTEKSKGKAGDKPVWKKAPEQGELKMWDPRAKGDTLTGPIASIGKGKYGPIIKVKDEKKGILALKNHSYLVNLFQRIEEEDGAPLVAGDLVKVVYTGKGTSDNGEFYMYDLEYARTQAPF